MQDVVTQDQKKKLWSVIGASSVGTLIEWYDFYIFGSLAAILATQFFPGTNPTAAFLSTLATFAAGFVVRPFGALVFGRLGDKVGRKYTFLVTLILMGGSTFLIGLVPSYESIGVAAPLIVLILRLVQGLALGGEYGGAATYVAEHSPAARRGYYTSFIQTTATLGLFVSLGVILIVRQSMSVEAFNSWGWRIPFLLSVFLVAISIYIRMKMEESPLFTKIKAAGKLSVNPIKESFGKKENLKMVLIALFGITAGQGVVWYTGQFYALSFIQKTCGVEFVQSNYIIAVALLIGTPLFIVFGAWSDRVGRKLIMLAGLVLAVFLYRPLYKGMYGLTDMSDSAPLTEERTADSEGLIKVVKQYADGTILTERVTASDNAVTSRQIVLGATSFWNMIALVAVQVILVTMVYGPIAAFLVELFPTRIRYTSMSLPYHIGNGIFGGLTPFIATSLYELSKTEATPAGDPFAGLWYPIGVAAVCFVIGMLFLSNKPRGEVLDDLG
ncbi:MAG: MHS family MFS transporter [Cyclobacteriaceae bacterium]|nr:MHS family MFS transporter [Cyclobacteriaceae bacterium]